MGMRFFSLIFTKFGLFAPAPKSFLTSLGQDKTRGKRPWGGRFRLSLSAMGGHFFDCYLHLPAHHIQKRKSQTKGSTGKRRDSEVGTDELQIFTAAYRPTHHLVSTWEFGTYCIVDQRMLK